MAKYTWIPVKEIEERELDLPEGHFGTVDEIIYDETLAQNVSDFVAKRNNQPEGNADTWASLTPQERGNILYWIDRNLIRQDTFNKNSYSKRWKGMFERYMQAMGTATYINEWQFVAAMELLGHEGKLMNDGAGMKYKAHLRSDYVDPF
jgi:hypothetical protein